MLVPHLQKISVPASSSGRPWRVSHCRQANQIMVSKRIASRVGGVFETHLRVLRQADRCLVGSERLHPPYKIAGLSPSMAANCRTNFSSLTYCSGANSRRSWRNSAAARNNRARSGTLNWFRRRDRSKSVCFCSRSSWASLWRIKGWRTALVWPAGSGSAWMGFALRSVCTTKVPAGDISQASAFAVASRHAEPQSVKKRVTNLRRGGYYEPPTDKTSRSSLAIE